MLSACTGTKYATEEDPLFNEFDIVFTSPPEDDPAEARSELRAVVTPTPNTNFLGMRPTVALHNMVKEPRKAKGIRNLLKYRIGSPAVQFNKVPLEDINKALVNRMHNRGYFAATSTYRVVREGRTASVIWDVAPGKPHRLRTILIGDSMDTGSDSALAALHPRMDLEPGVPYDLKHLTVERDAICDRLRDQGWYRLRSDDLLWVADTTVGNFQADVHLRIKSGISHAKRTRYFIGDVFVHGDHDAVLPASDTTLVGSLAYVNYLGMYRPSTITRGVFIKPGQHYSIRRSNATQTYLSSYGVFSSVTINYTEDSLRRDILHADVTLVPQKRFSLFSELNAISKSNNFAGPGIKVGFRDRDLFRGAEQFTLDLNTRFETQVAGAGRGTNAYEISTKAGLQIPRMLLLPFLRTTRSSVPLTNLELGYGLFRRIGLYGLESANAGLGYSWREGRNKWHELHALDVSYNNLYYTSEEFDTFLDANLAVRRSFDEQFIIGLGYTYTRSTQRHNNQRSWFVYTLGGDEAGLLTSGIYRGLEGPRPEEGYTLFGERYSQFVRFRPEIRWTKRLGARGSMFAFRTMAHAAFAYGNSTTVPYVKQFFAGGPNGLRGFRARSVGPGSYVGIQSQNLLIDQVGDLKLEANVEYRFTLSGMFKAAIFADAGNVWLLKDDPQRPGGQFESKDFINELALDAGFGLRIDPEIIVIRLDIAAPLHRPDLPAGDRWVFDDLETRWSRNFIVNIAIGYPF